MTVHARRVLDRMWRTALQVLVAYMLAATTLGGVNWVTALSATGFAVVFAAAQGLVDLPQIPGGWFPNALARALRTLGQTAAGGLSAATVLSDVHWVPLLSVSALAALTSFGTSLLATPFGPTGTVGTPELVHAEQATLH